MSWIAALVMHAFCWSVASAQTGPTPVSGDIAQNTVWDAAGAPYVVSGNVNVINGARLTVEPGVRVLFNPDAGIAVVSGALMALGTSAHPITFTSVHDVEGTPVQPAAGDWGVLHFGAGTIDSTTRLVHVDVRYGQGIVVNSASPTFEDMRIEHHAGPAIELDLAASPAGERISASGNIINGALVPAGVIHGNVVWRLKGIPYVVAQDNLEVGLPPFGLTPSTLQLVAGSTGQLTLTLPNPAPVGGVLVTLLSGNPSVVTVPPTALVAEGAHSALVTVTAVAAGSPVSVSASADGYGSAQSTVSVVSAPALQLTPAITSVGTGRVVEMTARLASGVAPSDIPVSLSGTGLAFTSPQTIPQGQPSVSFEVTGTTPGVRTLTATSAGYPPGTAQITVQQVQLIAPPTAFVVPGTGPVALDLTLSHPAPAGGLVIAVANPDTAALVAEDVNVAEGAMSAQVVLTGLIERLSPVVLTFTAEGYQSAGTSVTVQRISVRLGTGTQDITMRKGGTLSLPVRLSRAAPAQGLTISLASGTPGALSIDPAQVTIAGGQDQSAVEVSLQALDEGVSTVVMSAIEAAAIDGAARVTITPPVRLEFTRASVVVGKGLRLPTYAVSLRCFSGEQLCRFSHPLTINMSSSSPAHVHVPSQVTLAEQNWDANIEITGVTEAQSVEVSANLGGAAMGAALLVDVVFPELRFSGIGEEIRGVQASWHPRHSMAVHWHVPGAEFLFQRAPQNQVVQLSLEADPPGMVEGVYSVSIGGSPILQTTIFTGSSSSPTLFMGNAQLVGSYRLKASVQALGEWFSPMQEIEQQKLAFAEETLSIGLTLRKYTYLRMLSGSTCAVRGESTLVNLVSSNPAAVYVSSPVELPPNTCTQGGGDFMVEALSMAAEPVTITATIAGGQGADSPESPLVVTVIPKAVEFEGLDGVRQFGLGLGSSPDDFSVRWKGDGRSASDQIIDISVDELDSPGVLPSPPLLDAWGNPSNSLLIGAEATYSGNQLMVAGPQMLGRY